MLTAFGLPVNVFEASAAQLLDSLEGMRNTRALAQALKRDDPDRESQARRALQWLDHASDTPRALVTLADPGYPTRLLHLADPPLLLYVEGSVPALSVRQIAIVGSRNATATGTATARELACGLVTGGWAITSGLAEGIDQAAHLGALDRARENDTVTVAVMGTGVDRVYPARHRPLASAIARHGALVSEQPVGAAPKAEHFPRRNRLIAAFADGVLVVEAALRSGSLITARVAAELGREVFAVPGSIHSPQSRGCHWLIRQGACLVETQDNIESELSLTCPERSSPDHKAGSDHGAPANAATTNDACRMLLHALDGGPSTVDALQASTGWPTGLLLASLQKLEFEGCTGSGSDGKWYRVR